MDDHPWMIFGKFSHVFGGFPGDYRMISGHLWRFPDIPGGFGMFPDDSGAFQIVFGAFRSGGSPEKSVLFKN